MKTLKRIASITGILILALVAVAFLLPFLFKKQITTLVKEQINNSISARVDFKDVTLSVFSHFPKISISLEDLTVTGTGEFAKDTLISTKSLDASADLISAIKGKDIKVFGVFLESPRIHALVNKAGMANWDIAKDDRDTTSTASASSEFKMNLDQYTIRNGYIYYRDETSDMTAEISGLNHEGSGDFTSDLFTLSTRTTADAVNFEYGSIPYLSKTNANIAADIRIDNLTNTYTFNTQDIMVNRLRLSANGFLQIVNDSTFKMDVKFKTPSNEFKDILSLIPAIYKQDFDKIKTGGLAALNGFVKGTYGPKQMPAYDVNLEIKDGSFQYSDLPFPVKNIQLLMHAFNSDGRPDNTVIDIPKGHAEMGNEPVDFRLLFKNPETSRYIDAAIRGKLDLTGISKFLKVDRTTTLTGLVWADAFIRGNLSALQNQQGDFNAGGFLDIKNLSYSSPSFPMPLQNCYIKLRVDNNGGIADNTAIDITSGYIEIGQDPIDFTLQLRKPMSTADFSGTVKARLTLHKLKQFMKLEPGTTISGIMKADMEFHGNKTMIDKGEFEKIALDGTTTLHNVKYVSKDYPTGIKISKSELGFNQEMIAVRGFNASYLGTDFTAGGVIDNLIGFAMKDQLLTGVLDVTADKMNLNDWMITDTTNNSSSGTSPTGPFIVPANIDLTLHAKAGKVRYDKVDYKNINGTVILADETVRLQDVKTDALDGAMALNGSYSTKTNKKDPTINVNYDLKGVSVQKAFYACNTVQKLMPIAQFLDGKLHSQLSMTGKLNGDMMPDLNTLSGKGNLLLVEGLLKRFVPLEKLANVLQIDQLRSVSVKDVKQYIEFANGKVLINPFNLKVKDIEMQIGGLHGLDQSIDYIIEMKVPRKYLGNKGNELVNDLVVQATGKGLPVKLSDMVDLNIKMGGSITDPSLQIDLQKVVGNAKNELKEQAKDFAKAKADTVRRTVKDTLAKVKNLAVNDLKADLKSNILGTQDSARTNNIDSTRKNATQTVKNTIGNLLKKKKPATDTDRKQ